MFNLANKNIIVTGGNGHLGKAICEVLAEYKANLFIASRNYDDNVILANNLSSNFGNRNVAIQFDLSDISSIDNLFDYFHKNGIEVDVLINNAFYTTGKELHKMTDEEWNFGIEGTLSNITLLTKRILSLMVEQQSGKIINIASMYGVVSPDPQLYEGLNFYNAANYGVAKAGLIQLTKYIASFYGKYGITCNAISPGPFPNPEVLEHETFIDRLVNKVPLGRIGKPDELKGIALLLSSDESSYINGANICVDGGWTII